MIRCTTEHNVLHGGWTIALITRLIIALYFIETGVLLIVAPWTDWWRRNFFAQVWPWLAPVMSSPAVQGAVVLAGVVTLLGGLREARGLFAGARS